MTQIVPEEVRVANLTQGTTRISSKGLAKFYLQSLASQAVRDNVSAVSEGSTLREISLYDLRKIHLRRPDLAKQQRISAGLTALDTQITAQAAQIESLQTHKRGLMQQLFPSTGDAT
ncbi:hypothetical protein Pr1d_05970 [Bythopirellula goksoeyrii]|uniref:Type I restriction modification DNA specificity domain-containing protein n=1 Tax=Bythopirellula goksoeyrii TaxID=1400387 RepID=A0A5B9Q8U6_9BACT|nr:hypothetical protein Pr1d_05970 [Bythopirellula goksoeyrii]